MWSPRRAPLELKSSWSKTMKTPLQLSARASRTLVQRLDAYGVPRPKKT